MKTRIKYHRKGKNYTSEYLTNCMGKKFIVFLHFGENGYKLWVSNEKGDSIDFGEYETSSIAKRKARLILINKYEVRLNDEIRQGI